MARRFTSFLAGGAVLVSVLGAPAVALAIDQATLDRVSHFVECAGWLLTDPDKHAQLCGPSQVSADQLAVFTLTVNHGTLPSGSSALPH